jgi:ATP adenylyltransferase
MRRLWAPWRMEYIGAPAESGCLFCTAWRAKDPASALVLGRGQRVFVLLNRFPYNSGHLMIAPRSHVPSLASLDRESLCDMMRAAQLCEKALVAEYAPQGFNIGVNIGVCAGAGVPDHVHLHMVPRWTGDTNFMPVAGDTKVLPESLERTYARLEPVLRASLAREGI